MTSTPLHQGPAKILSFATGREIQPSGKRDGEQREQRDGDHNSHFDPVKFNAALAQIDDDIAALVHDALNGDDEPRGAA